MLYSHTDGHDHIESLVRKSIVGHFMQWGPIFFQPVQSKAPFSRRVLKKTVSRIQSVRGGVKIKSERV